MSFQELGSELGAFIDDRQIRYGNSFEKCGEFLQLLYPNGIQPEQYTDMLAIVRIFDKQMRLATGKNDDGETPYKDIAGYGLLGWMKDEKRAKGEEINGSSEGQEVAQRRRYSEIYEAGRQWV